MLLAKYLESMGAEVAGGADPETKRRLLKLGALDLLLKPVHAHQIAKVYLGSL